MCLKFHVKLISFTLVIPLSTTTVSPGTTGEICLITDGMADVNIIPNENIVNSKNVSIGHRVRLTETSLGYTPASANDKIIIKLTNDNSQIAIGEIVINAQNFQSASLFIKTTNDNTFNFYADLTQNITTFDNLYATELQFQFTNGTRYIKLGISGCFPPPGKKN